MASKTEQFKSAGSSLGKTIGQSWSMITGRDVPNYSLLFLDDTSSKKRGDHETIFMPHIVMGRSSKCHIRYGEEFRTVSREHASITVEGSNFILTHNPVASNPTYVNGRTVGAPYALQNGDEIQLSSNGPKLRFNTSTLKTSTLGITNRIGQAMAQAVKPYKTALWVMGLLLLGSLAFSGWNMYTFAKAEEEYKNQIIAVNEKVEKGELTIAEAQEQIKDLINRPANTRIVNRYIKDGNNDLDGDGLIGQLDKCPNEFGPVRCEGCPTCGGEGDGSGGQGSGNQAVVPPSPDPKIDNSICANEVELNKVLPKEDVVLLVLKRIDVSLAGESGYIGVPDFYKYTTNVPVSEDRSGISYGTAFVTDRDKIITARHVVQPWRYYNTQKDEKARLFWQTLNAIETNGGTVEAIFDIITSTGKWSEQITFRSGNISHDNDNLVDFSNSKDKGVPKELKSKDLFPKESKIKIVDVSNKTRIAESTKSDWVSLDFNITGKINNSKAKSQTLRSGTTLHVLGYSHIGGAMDLSKWAGSSYSKTIVANDATLNDVIFVSGQTFGPGNSGGPAFICEEGELKCIGVVVAGVGTSNAYIVPVGQIRG